MQIQFEKTRVSALGPAPAGEAETLARIELCGRTAYKSEDKITGDSARAFVSMLKKHGHLSVLEHSNIVLRVVPEPGSDLVNAANGIFNALRDRNAYHRLHALPGDDTGAFAMSGNCRSWIETLKQLKSANPGYHALLAAPLQHHYPVLFAGPETPAPAGATVSLMSPEQQLDLLREDPESDLPVFIFKIVCDRGITHEIVRHRVLSFTQESTRYVNYRNKGMSLILTEELEPLFDEETGEFREITPEVRRWLDRAETLFGWYLEDLNRGLKPQIARDILPNLLKSEIYVSGRWSGWKHFILLREAAGAHPRAQTIAAAVRRAFDEQGIRI